MESINDKLDQIKDSIELIESTKESYKYYEERNTERSNELSININQIKALQRSNDKYINENKALNSLIEYAQEEFAKLYDKCDDLNRFNKN